MRAHLQVRTLGEGLEPDGGWLEAGGSWVEVCEFGRNQLLTLSLVFAVGQHQG